MTLEEIQAKILELREKYWSLVTKPAISITMWDVKKIERYDHQITELERKEANLL